MRDYDIIIKYKELMSLSSDTEAAESLGISHPVISYIKNNKKELSLKTVQKMCALAGDEIAQMWGALQAEKATSLNMENPDAEPDMLA